MTRSARPKTAPAPAPAAAAVAASEQFRAIAELRGDVAFIIDCGAGLPTYVSAAADSLLGYGMADFVDQFAGRAGDGALAALCGGLDARLRRFAAGDASRTTLVRRHAQRRKDGRVVPLEVISTILAGPDGQAQWLVGALRDVSEEHQRMEEQRRFASMLNHEFRTPLSTIDGAIQRLEVTGAHADEPTRLRYRKISGAVDQLIGMLDQYLSPDRLEQIGYEKRAAAASPRALLDEAAQLLRAAGRPVQLDVGALPDSLRGQPEGLRMALKVLVDNALQYSPVGSPVLLAGHPAEGGIALTVRDQGSGVPDDETDRIFGKNYRARNAAGNGSGLGLYLARAVVEQHGGSLGMRNCTPSGAEFRLWLPPQRSGGKYVASEVSNCDNSCNQQIRVGTEQK